MATTGPFDANVSAQDTLALVNDLAGIGNAKRPAGVLRCVVRFRPYIVGFDEYQPVGREDVFDAAPAVIPGSVNRADSNSAPPGENTPRIPAVSAVEQARQTHAIAAAESEIRDWRPD